MNSRVLTLSVTVVVLTCILSAPAQLDTAKNAVVFDWRSSDTREVLTSRIERLGTFEAAEVRANPESVARQILRAATPQIMGLREEAAGAADVNKHLLFERSFTDQLGDTTAVFHQTFDGVPVYGSDVRVHLGSNGKARGITSKFLSGVKLSTVASVSPRQALERATSHSEQPKELAQQHKEPPQLAVYQSGERYYLVWIVSLAGIEKTRQGPRPARWKYFIDAQEGTVITRFNDLKFQTSASGTGRGTANANRSPLFTTQLADDLFILEDISMPGHRIRTFDFKYRDFCLDELPGTMLRNSSNDWNRAEDATAVDAHYYARMVFDYYWTAYSRNSLDNRGMDLVSSVRGTYRCYNAPNQELHKWNNAVWTGTQMVYGDGDGVSYGPFSGSLDVVAHEFTHGVTEYTANLEYRNQSGALNESYSDVFAAMIDNANWEIGEDVVLPKRSGKALRSLADPPRFGQPDHMRNYVVTDEDNGGVHWNSGIPNKVAYLLATGGTHNGISVQPLGREITAQIYYLTLTKYLSQLSDFADARRQTLKAAQDLYPGDQSKVVAISNAFASVGIGEPTTSAQASGGTITIVAYGDTRTGPWGLGDNARQATHRIVIDNIFNTAKSVDAIAFTADAVMTNFWLWGKAYWRSFLAQSDRFVYPLKPDSGAPRIPFYPTLGNHETYRNLPLVMEYPKTALTSVPSVQAEPRQYDRELELALSKAYSSGEESAANSHPSATTEPTAKVDFSKSTGMDQLYNWVQAIETGSPEESRNAALQFGRFEGAIQADFYKQSAERRCSDDARIFSDAYLKLAGYDYLKQLTAADPNQMRSFYTTILGASSGLKVKLISLDSNCLDYQPQYDFFKAEVSKFSGPIIVFAHHPPIDPNVPAASWDKVPGWELYKPYLSDAAGRNIRLWIFGHVHNYQRRNAPASAGTVPSPVMLITGGGGASDLSDSEAGNQWQPDGWVKPFPIAGAYHFALISVAAKSIGVEVYGSRDRDTPFAIIDKFSIALQ